jgi:hypothetical protein
MKRSLLAAVGLVVLLAACAPAPGGPGGGSETTLAIAYSNLDGVAGYDAAHDVMIAELVDTSGNGGPYVLTTAHYPLNFSPQRFPNDFGAFQEPRNSVINVERPSPDLLVATMEAPDFRDLQVQFQRNPDALNVAGGAPLKVPLAIQQNNANHLDILKVSIGEPFAGTVFVLKAQQHDPNEDDFLEVEIRDPQ